MPRPTLRILLLLLCLWFANAAALQPEDGGEPRIAVNQMGYLPDAAKRAMVLNATSQAPLELVQTPDRVMAELPLQTEKPDKDQGLPVQWVDFSKVRLPGEYFLRQGELKSATFRLGDDVYANPSWLLQRSYYLQRCGVAIHDRISGLEHAACHTSDAL